MRYTRRSLLASLGASTLAAGCLGAPGSSEGESVSLLLNWTPNGLHTPYYAAREEGFYEAEGITVSGIRGGDGSDFSARQAGLGNTEFAVTSSDQVLLTNGGGVDVSAVGVRMQRSPNVVFATRDSLGEPLEDPDQLAGARIGTGPGMVRMLTELYLDAVGVREDVELVETGYNTVQRLLNGDVDAAGGVFGDAIDARYQGATVDSLRVASELPAYGHLLATSPSYAAENPETVRAFLRATARGAAWATNNPEAGVDAVVSANESLREVREQTRATWERMAESFVVGPAVKDHGWGWQQSNPWATVVGALRDTAAGEVADPDEVWTNEYLDTGSPYVDGYADRVS
jgi:NitT/TauT family transport system substrate-binding protein